MQSHCLRGHPYPESLRTSGSGCAVCNRERIAKWRRDNGIPLRGPAGSNWPCNHDPSLTMRPGRTDCYVCHRSREAARYADHPEKGKAASRAWAHRNPDKVKAAKAAWRAENRSLTKASDRLRRQDTSPETKEWVRIIMKDPCSYCGKPFEHVDHIDAVSTGGAGDWENLTSACGPCNMSKQAKPLLAFLFSRH